MSEKEKLVKELRRLMKDTAFEGIPDSEKDRITYFILADRKRVLQSINEIIFAKGAPLGSEEYFQIRKICSEAYK